MWCDSTSRGGTPKQITMRRAKRKEVGCAGGDVIPALLTFDMFSPSRLLTGPERLR